MKAEKQYTEGISTANNKFVSWLENYWYHYKWITLVVAFLVVVVAVCTIQSCTAKSSDINITYAGKALFSESDKKQLFECFGKVCDGLEKIISGDVDGAMQICNSK